MKILIVLSVSIVLASCASSSATYVNSSPHNIENKAVIDKPFETTWNEFVSRASEDFFVVNNISKESRFINMSVSSGNPSRYVDCGRYKGEYTLGSHKEIYDNNLADSFQYHHAVGLEVWQINWNTSLDSRINVYMAPIGNKTEIKVSAKYVLDARVDQYETIYRRPGASSNLSFVFDSNNSDTGTYKQGKNSYSVTCRSRGVVESNLIHLVK